MPIPVANAGTYANIPFGSLPTSQNLTGSGTFFAPATSIVGYQWILLDVPTGSSASLSSTTVQNPVLNNIDIDGAHRLMLVVEDDTGQFSESDPLLAPDSAFCIVQVTTQRRALSAPAVGERNWKTKLTNVIGVVDTNYGAITDHVADVSDPHETLSNTGVVNVTNDPSGAGEVLLTTGATTAAWGASSLSVATTASQGTVALDEAPVDPLNPKAITRERIVFTATVNGHWDGAAWQPATIAAPPTGGPSGALHMVFRVPSNIVVVDWFVAFEDGGLTANTYDVDLVRLTSAQHVSRTYTDVLDTISMSPGVSNAPVSNLGTVPGTPAVVTGNFLGVRVTGGSGGRTMSVAIQCQRRV